MDKNPTKKMSRKYFSIVGSLILVTLLIAMLAAPEISDYFKHRSLPSDKELKASAFQDFQKYKTKHPTNEDELNVEETGNSHFPYLINYRYFPNDKESIEKLYLYSDDVNDWIIASESSWSLEGGDTNEINHSSPLLP